MWGVSGWYDDMIGPLGVRAQGTVSETPSEVLSDDVEQRGVHLTGEIIS